MSEHIVHSAVLEDAFRITLTAEIVPPVVTTAMTARMDLAEMAGVTRLGDLFTVGLLEAARTALVADGELDDVLVARLAFTLGWICHRATDREFKPVFRQAEPDRTQKPSECSVYHEAWTIRELYLPDEPERFPLALFGKAGEPPAGDAVERLVQTVLRRALIQMHTLIPDVENVDTWIDNLSNRVAGYYVNVGRYAAALHSPDPEKVRRFITDVNFLDQADPVVVVGRRLRRHESVNRDAARHAIDHPGASHYAQAVKRSIDYIVAAGEFLEGKIGSVELGDRFDIGRPGPDGIGV